MKRILYTIVATGLFAGASFAQPSEQVVTMSTSGQPFVGTLVTPAGDPAPVVLLLHGFTGSRDELPTDHVPSGVFAYTADKLAEAGLASLRIDFRGSGESLADMAFEDTTFESQIADAEAAVAYLKELDSVDGSSIHALGWSQGGLVAASLAGRGAEVETLSLWNAVGDPKATFGSLFGPDLMAQGNAAAADEAIVATLPWGAEVTLKGGFFEGIQSNRPLEEITGFAGPLFVAAGTQDTVVLPEFGQQFIEAHEGEETLWVADMDHVFNVFANTETLDDLIANNISFLTASQN